MGGLFIFKRELFVFLRNFVVYLPARFFQILDGRGSAGLLEGADRFVCQLLCILQDFAGLLIGLSDDTVAGLVDFYLLGFQPFF